MAVANGNIYFYGNSDGELLRLTLPSDICNLFSANRVGCIQQTGCAFCALENEGNQTICYAQHKRAESRYNTCYQIVPFYFEGQKPISVNHVFFNDSCIANQSM